MSSSKDTPNTVYRAISVTASGSPSCEPGPERHTRSGGHGMVCQLSIYCPSAPHSPFSTCSAVTAPVSTAPSGGAQWAFPVGDCRRKGSPPVLARDWEDPGDDTSPGPRKDSPSVTLKLQCGLTSPSSDSFKHRHCSPGLLLPVLLSPSKDMALPTGTCAPHTCCINTPSSSVHPQARLALQVQLATRTPTSCVPVQLATGCGLPGLC